MLIIRINLVHVDYEKLALRLIPEAFTEEVQGGNLTKKLAGRLLVKDGEVNSFMKGMMKLIPNETKNALAYHLVLRNQGKLLEAFNQAMAGSRCGIEASRIRFLDTEREVYDMLKLELVLKEVDYKAVVMQLLPILLGNMSSQEGRTGELGKTLEKLGDIPSRMLFAAFDALSQEEKDTLLTQLSAVYQKEIVSSLNDLAKAQKIAAEVAELHLTAHNTEMG